MRIYVETNGTVDFLDLAKRIASKVKSRIGFTPLVKVVEIGLLPRSEKRPNVSSTNVTNNNII